MEYIDNIFNVICHQEPARCLHYAGAPFVLCARCSGIYIGFLLAMFFQVIWRATVARWLAGTSYGIFRIGFADEGEDKARSGQGILTAIFLLFFAMQPLQVALEQINWLQHSSNQLRFNLGILTGAGFAYFVLPIFGYFCLRKKTPDFYIRSGVDFLALSIFLFLGYSFFSGGSPIVFDIALALSIIGLVGLFIMANASVIFMIARWRERRNRKAFAVVLSLVVAGVMVCEFFMVSYLTGLIRIWRSRG